MRSILVFIAFAVAVASAADYKLPKPPQCGDMIGDLAEGSAVGVTEFPWTALLTYGSTTKGFISCTAVLISRRHVLTFAVCLESHLYSLYFWPGLYLGLREWKTNELCVVDQCRSENKVGYLAQPAHDGLTILRLRHDFEIDNKTRPICLPSALDFYTPPAPGDTLYLTGWGKPSLTLPGDTIKTKRVMTVLDKEDCERRIGKPVKDADFCVEGDNSGCFGYLGGPLMRKVGESWILESVLIDNMACWGNRPIFVVPKITAREELIDSILDNRY